MQKIFDKIREFLKRDIKCLSWINKIDKHPITEMLITVFVLLYGVLTVWLTLETPLAEKLIIDKAADKIELHRILPFPQKNKIAKISQISYSRVKEEHRVALFSKGIQQSAYNIELKMKDGASSEIFATPDGNRSKIENINYQINSATANNTKKSEYIKYSVYDTTILLFGILCVIAAYASLKTRNKNSR